MQKYKKARLYSRNRREMTQEGKGLIWKEKTVCKTSGEQRNLYLVHYCEPFKIKKADRKATLRRLLFPPGFLQIYLLMVALSSMYE